MPGLGARVLIADDNENDRWLMERAFAAVLPDIRPEFVRDGREVIEFLDTANPLPDLLVLDHRMTRVDAFGVLKWLRQKPELAAIPVLIVSGANAATDVEKAMQLGARAYVSKPFDFAGMKQLVASLKQYLKTANG